MTIYIYSPPTPPASDYSITAESLSSSIQLKNYATAETVQPFRVNATGIFKLVLLVPGTSISAGSSLSFQLEASAAGTKSLDKTSYFHGERIVATIDPKFLNYSDHLHHSPRQKKHTTTTPLPQVFCRYESTMMRRRAAS